MSKKAEVGGAMVAAAVTGKIPVQQVTQDSDTVGIDHEQNLKGRDDIKLVRI